MEHQADWNDVTKISSYAYTGSRTGIYNVPTLITRVHTRALAPDSGAAGFRILRSFDASMAPIHTEVSPGVDQGGLFPERKTRKLALPLLNKLVNDFGDDTANTEQIAALLGR